MGGLIPAMEKIAQETAERVIDIHKKDMELRLYKFKDELMEGFDSRLGARLEGVLGKQTSHEHYESHKRLDRLLTFLDDVQTSVLRKTLSFAMIFAAGGGLILFVFWDKIIK